MSWKYSSCLPRDNLSSRDSKFGILNSKSSNFDRRSVWSSSLTSDNSKFLRGKGETTDHGPVWSRTNDNQASVQRLKERYNGTDDIGRDVKTIKRTETKELPVTKSGKFYGRSYTSLNIDEKPSETNSSYSKFRRKLNDKSPADLDLGKQHAYESKFNINLQSPTSPMKSSLYSSDSKLPLKKYATDFSPTSLENSSRGDEIKINNNNNKSKNHQENLVTVVTRGTSPTPTVSTVYLRSKRFDYGLEKTISRPLKKPEMVNKEVQTDREDFSVSKYSLLCDNVRTKPKTSYVDKYSPSTLYTPKYSTRNTYGTDVKKEYGNNALGETNLNATKRSVSREEQSDVPTTPESPNKIALGRPPSILKTPTGSFIRDPDSKLTVRRSPPSSFRSSSFMTNNDSSKTDLQIKSPTSPKSPIATPLQCKITHTEPVMSVNKVINENHPPPINIVNCSDMHAIDSSSASESSEEEEESSSDESDNQTTSCSPMMAAKKSISNFLQNIPHALRQSQSRSNLYAKSNNPSTQKSKFHRISSGEKPWWLDNNNNDRVPDGVIVRMPSVRSVPNTSVPEFQGSKSPTSKNFSLMSSSTALTNGNSWPNEETSKSSEFLTCQQKTKSKDSLCGSRTDITDNNNNNNNYDQLSSPIPNNNHFTNNNININNNNNFLNENGK